MEILSRANDLSVFILYQPKKRFSVSFSLSPKEENWPYEKAETIEINDFRFVNPMGFKPMTFRTGI
ncbi:MAG TPA: hypothetical protein DEQ27_06395 [Prevotella sp.]|nr:hypothetical protein [Prevotella sp.]